MRADEPTTELRDDGSAMILVLMVLMLATALGATLGAVTINNLQSARRVNESSAVLNAAEAGVSQAITFMRQNGVSKLRCRQDVAGAWTTGCSTAYGRDNPVGPAALTAEGANYSVWVEEVVRFSPVSPAEGVYLVHSVGILESGKPATCQPVDGACRSVTAKVVVTNFGLGTGIYSKAIQGNSNGNATITDQSIFTTGCFPMRGRSSLDVSGFDDAHGIPAGVHTSGIIVDGPASWCGSASNSIHADGKACSPLFPNDQDSQGGEFSASSACGPAMTANSSVYGAPESPGPDPVYGSRIASQKGMQDTFGLKYPPVTDDQAERLREIALEDDTYRTDTTWPDLATAGLSRGVFFFDLSGKSGKRAEVDLASIPSPFNQESGACSGAVIVIKNGNATISPSNSDAVVGASIILLSPGGGTGIATLNGGHLYGGLFAEAIDFSGNTYLQPADCTDDSSNPALLTIDVTSYSEDD